MLYRNIERFKYQLASDETWQTPFKGYSFDTEFMRMTPDGLFTLKYGYLSDGASGIAKDSQSSFYGFFLHDGIYECFRRGLIPLTEENKIIADTLLHNECEKHGMEPVRADIWYDMVKVFGWNSCIPGSETKDIILEV